MSSSSIHPTVRVRFAPSPTGYLHVGGARTALYNYLFAKANGGEFILRIEDTDEARSTEESLKMVIEDLKWLGLTWNEGPHPETLKDMGPYGPYKQSERLSIYKEIAETLLKEGKAYYCFMTDAEIDQQRAEQKAKGDEHAHLSSPYQNWTLKQAQEKLAQGSKAVVRFKTQNLKKDYIFKDHIRGEVKFPSDMVGDFVLLRSDGMPVYNFCCVVDDHLMKITHVLRAEEHLPNTLRQLMIYEAMNWTVPEFAHMSLILDEDRQKLSKRKGATSCHQFKEEGYLPGALLNFICLLGWSHPEEKEIMDVAEMAKHFTLNRLHPAGAVFDRVKLKWMNSMHLRALPSMEIWNQIEGYLRAQQMDFSDHTADWKEKSVNLFKSYIETFAESVEFYKPLDDKNYQIFPEAQETFAWEPTRKVLEAWRDLISARSEVYMTEEEFLKIQDEVKNKTGAKGKNLFMPIRVAVIGKPHGAELKILVPLMTQKSLIDRANKVLAQLPN